MSLTNSIDESIYLNNSPYMFIASSQYCHFNFAQTPCFVFLLSLHSYVVTLTQRKYPNDKKLQVTIAFDGLLLPPIQRSQAYKSTKYEMLS